MAKGKKTKRKPFEELGTTRQVFMVGSSLLGFLVLCLGIGLFFDVVTADKMQIIAGFLPLAFGSLGAMKVGDAWVEAKYEEEENEEDI